MKQPPDLRPLAEVFAKDVPPHDVWLMECILWDLAHSDVSDAEAFLWHCHRNGLDPQDEAAVARQRRFDREERERQPDLGRDMAAAFGVCLLLTVALTIGLCVTR